MCVGLLGCYGVLWADKVPGPCHGPTRTTVDLAVMEQFILVVECWLLVDGSVGQCLYVSTNVVRKYTSSILAT